MVSEKKIYIQRKFWEKLALKVDQPKQAGFGSTNVGNTSHYELRTSTDNLTDVFQRALDTSDPIISSLNLNRRIQKHKRLAPPLEVIQLLSCELETEDEPSVDADL